MKERTRWPLPAVLLLIGVVASVSLACFALQSSGLPRATAEDWALVQSLRPYLPPTADGQPDTASGHLRAWRGQRSDGGPLLFVEASGNFDETSALKFADQLRRARDAANHPVPIHLSVVRLEPQNIPVPVRTFDFN